MGLFYDRLRTIELDRVPARPAPRPAAASRSREARAILLRRWHARPFQVVTVSSNKGGVGKTTLAANLAVYLRALREDLPILIFGLDDQSLLDRMFALEGREPVETVASALRAGSFATAIQPGQYGIHYVPSDPCVAALKDEIDGVLTLHDALDRTGWQGVVIVDTKSDLEVLTRNAIAAGDLTLVPVCDDASLQEGLKVFELLDRWALPRTRARVVLSMLDLRVRYAGANLEGLLRSELDRLELPSIASFLSNSPKVQSLGTNPEGRSHSILHGAPRSLVNGQMRALAQEVLDLLGTGLELPARRTSARRLAPPNSAKRYLLRGLAQTWRKHEPADEAVVDRLVGEIHCARAR